MEFRRSHLSQRARKMGHPSFMVVSAKYIDPAFGGPWLCQGLRCLRMTAFRTANASFRFHPKTSSEDQAVWLAEEVPGFAVVGVGVAAGVALGAEEQ